MTPYQKSHGNAGLIGRWARELGVALITFAGISAALAQPMGLDDARHLLARAGFGGSPRELAALAQLSRDDAVKRLLAETRTTAQTPLPAWFSEVSPNLRSLQALGPDERRKWQQEQNRRVAEAQAWWLREMIVTPSPLTERMALFWHNHFVSSQRKVRNTQYLVQQNLLLREHALAQFGPMLHAVARDPAMLQYLDSNTNRKGRPNENFAREVMELFTLGEGHYTEADVREAARAFTGWSIDRDSGTVQLRPEQHDNGSKTIFGRTADFDSDGALDLLLQQPATAEFIVTKLWREFVSMEPDATEVSRIAARFRDSGYEIKVALAELLSSTHFWSDQARGGLIKSPVELIIGTIRQFEIEVPETQPLAGVAAQLGQALFLPPNVRGWPGGETWISSASLLNRKQFLERVFRAEERAPMRPPTQSAAQAPMQAIAQAPPRNTVGAARARGLAAIQVDADRWLAQVDSVPALGPQRAVLAIEPVVALQKEIAGRGELRALVLDPAYQLK